jgi:hypothetical protein
MSPTARPRPSCGVAHRFTDGLLDEMVEAGLIAKDVRRVPHTALRVTWLVITDAGREACSSVNSLTFSPKSGHASNWTGYASKHR